ncbi:MAG: Crp/Fnr family transcriptional regulator [Ardenticatenaceae bacterium]|nr:Crp/Fnr family transcriptional regulator [Ardenticatenaceae bacterium]
MKILSPLDLLLLSDKEQIVFRALTKKPKQTVNEIALHSGLSLEEVSTAVNLLLAQGSLIEQLQEGKRLLSVRLQLEQKSVRNMPVSILAALSKGVQSFLLEIPLLQVLAAEELEELVQISRKRTLLADEVLAWQGENFNFVAVIESGLVVRTRLKGQHLSEKAGYARRTEWMGLSSVLSNSVASETYTAVTETTLRYWPKQDFLDYLHEHARLAIAICQQLSQEIETCKSTVTSGRGKLWVIEGVKTAVGVTTFAQNLAQIAFANRPHGAETTTLLWQSNTPPPTGKPTRKVKDLATIYAHPSGVDQLVLQPNHEYPPQVQLDILLDELLATYEYVVCDTGASESEELVLRLRGQGHVLLTLSNDPDNLETVFARWKKAQTYAVPNQKRFLALSNTSKQVRDVDPRFHLVLPYDPTLAVETHRQPTTNPANSLYSDAIQEVYRRLSLNHALAIFVPSTLDVDCPVDNDHQVQSTLQFLGSVFGGATKSDAEGVWRSEDSGLVTEQVTIVRTFVSKPALDTHLDTVVEFATHLKEEMKQEAVALSVDHQLILV